MTEIACPFCSPPPAPFGGMTIAFLVTDMCDELSSELDCESVGAAEIVAAESGAEG